VLFINKLHENFKNTGGGKAERMHCAESCFKFSCNVIDNR